MIAKPKIVEPACGYPRNLARRLGLAVVEPTEVDLNTIMSDREREVALLVTEGLSNKEIGQYLAISHWTVSTHLRRIFAKLDISRRVELCAIVSAARWVRAKRQGRL